MTGTEASTGAPTAPAISSRSRSLRSVRPIETTTMPPSRIPASAPSPPVSAAFADTVAPVAGVAQDVDPCGHTSCAFTWPPGLPL